MYSSIFVCRFIIYSANWVKSILSMVIFTLKLQNLEIVRHFIPQEVWVERMLLKNDQSVGFARGQWLSGIKYTNPPPPPFIAWSHGRMNYKDTKPYMSAFLSVDLLTDFAAFCLTDFIDWRYIHSWFVFSTQLVNCCPHGRRNYTCVLPLYCTFSLTSSPFPPFPNYMYTVQYIQTVCVWGGGGWIVLQTIFCRNFTLCFWPDSKPTKLLHHPK